MDAGSADAGSTASAGRLFLAVDPPPSAVAALAAVLGPLRGLPGAPRWTEPARWHLTLLFLGDVAAALLPPFTDRVAAAVAGTPPLRLRLAGGGRFGTRRRPAVCWAGVDGDVAGLAALAGRLADVARATGLPVEDRPFRPHLTVGRWRPGQAADPDLPDRLAGAPGPAWPVTEVVLRRSTLGAEPRHDRVDGWPVG